MGSTIIVGSRVWQVQTKFRLRFGPMKLADLKRMLPNQGSFKRLKTWIRNYCGDELFWDAQYVLLADEVPGTQLGNGGFPGLDDLGQHPQTHPRRDASLRICSSIPSLN